MYWSFPFTLIALAFWSFPTWAAGVKAGDLCFRGCQFTLQAAQFNDSDPKAPKLRKSCQSRMKATSLYLCTKLYCSTITQTISLGEYNHTCQVYANTTLPPFSIIAHYTDDEISQLRRLEREDTLGGSVLGEVVVPSKKLFRLTYDTLDYWNFETTTHTLYGWIMVYFWAAIVSIGLCSRLITKISKLQRQEWQLLPNGETQLEESPSSKKRSSLFDGRLIKQYLTVPAAFGRRCAQPIGWCTIPQRSQTIAIAIFTVINIVLCSISYRVFEENLYWPRVYAQLCRYISDRTGILSLANFPIIWLFGTRNNVLMWLTGWGFGAYNNFHRWVARISTAEAVAHSIGYTIMVFIDGGWDYFVAFFFKKFWWAGEIATIGMCLILAFSVYGLRRSYYEIFLFLHIVFSVIVLVTMWWHVEIFKGEYNGYIWPCIIIWILDRIIRSARILAFNPRFWSTEAISTYDPESKIVRLNVPFSTSFYKPKAGTYYYLYVLNDMRMWENHPFTLAYVTKSSTTDTDSSERRASIDESRVRSSSDVSSEDDALLTPLSPETDPSMVFIIRPYDGFTARLRDSASAGATNPRVLIEGPYGETQALHTFDSVLFIVGGTGVATPLSYLSTLLREDCRTTTIHIVWAVREHAFLVDVVGKELKDALGNEKLSLVSYITQDEENKDDLGRGLPETLQVFGGRPNVYEEVEEAARNTGNGSLAVVACGPPQMADDARAAVVDMLGKGWGQIEYFEESFKW